MEIPESNLSKLQPPVIEQETSSSGAARIILTALWFWFKFITCVTSQDLEYEADVCVTVYRISKNLHIGKQKRAHNMKHWLAVHDL